VRHLLRLADGATLLVRPLTAGDRDALDAAVARLSPTSRLLRFAAPKPRLTKADLDRLLDLDHHDREAVVAVDPGTGEGVAVARYAAMPGEPRTAEIAVTVADAWQGRGLGAALTEMVVARAREEGFARLHAVAMGENRRAVRMLRAGGFTHVRTGSGLTEYDLVLGRRSVPVI
jgi:RimJ/RimL family protein N-acetyltransferase